jgi:hypothetical protein
MGIALLATVALGVGAPAAAAYEASVVADGGTITGTVRFRGAPPRGEPRAIDKDRATCGERQAPEALVVDETGGVKGAVIMVDGVRRGKRLAGGVVIDAVQCRFVPHVAATVVGGPVLVKNSDAVLHSAHGVRGRAPVFHVALPGRDQAVDVARRLSEPGIVRIVCEAHPHMLAWLVVHDSPYVAVTDEHGGYRIEGLPAGTYTVRMWHAGFTRAGIDKQGRPLSAAPRTSAREVTVASRSTTTLDFELK